jgi:hypothetical protein
VSGYTDIAGLEAIVLEESYVLGVCAGPGTVALRVDFVLTAQHPDYAPPLPDETECFRRGRILFEGVRRLQWEGQGAPPATDATGEADYGHVDSFEWDEDTYRLGGDFGKLTVSASTVRVAIDGGLERGD